MGIKTRFSTLIGSGALALWAIEPLVVAELMEFPLFEALSIVFISCFLLTAFRVTVENKWNRILKQPLFVWIFGIVAICGSDFCYMLGAFSAPIAHVDLIDYLWPCFIIVFVGFLPREKFSFKHFIGAGIGLFGVSLLLNKEGGGINPHYTLGYMLAAYGAIIWGAYSAFSRVSTVPSDMVGIYCGVGAIISIIFHCCFEITVIPTTNQAIMAVLLGLAGPGLAYQLWDHGAKYGNVNLLSVSCYFARMVGMVLLVFYGKEPFSMELVAACILVTFGLVISSIKYNYVKKVFVYLYTLTRTIICSLVKPIRALATNLYYAVISNLSLTSLHYTQKN